MKKQRTLLVPFDGSPCAQRALALACQRYLDGGYASVVALNVQTPMASSQFVSEQMIHDHQHQLSEEALEKARKVAAKFNITLVCATACEEPATAIVGFARKSKGDEIIMGTRGLGRLGGLLLGSTATRVVQLADVPVTLVK